MLIRPETEEDFAAIRDIHIAAFENHPHSRQTEHLIVEALRAACALSISLVAVIEGKAVGHIAFSSAWIDGVDCNWYILGPVGVRPEFQRRGIGQSLIQAGLQGLRDRGAQGCVLVGNPEFYCRFGFCHVQGLILEGSPQESFLCLPLVENSLRGVVTYHSAFAVRAENISHPEDPCMGSTTSRAGVGAVEFGYLDLLGEPEFREQPDAAVVEVKLVPGHAVAG